MPDPELRAVHLRKLTAGSGLEILQSWQASKPPREATYDELDVLVKTRQKLKRVRCSLRAAGCLLGLTGLPPPTPFTSWRSRTG